MTRPDHNPSASTPRLPLRALPSTLAIALTISLAPLIGCGDPSLSSDSNVKLPTTTMTIGGRPFVLEKAVTSGEQTLGLMRRDSLPSDHGMIFICAKPQIQSFWNHDVRFPLDNVFIDSDGKIVSIQQMKAYDDSSTKPVVAQYVIELNAGAAAELGLKMGDRLSLPADAVAH
jgi:uncharacterized membrane protein (UPF0127 family)